MPLSAIGKDIPAMFRRAAIHAALGSARSFSAHLKTWRTRRAKMLAKGKTFLERPPVPPRSWNKSTTLYFGQWKERTSSSILLKVWTGSCWSWLKVRLAGRELPEEAEAGSPALALSSSPKSRRPVSWSSSIWETSARKRASIAIGGTPSVPSG
jgi:hypothetical protein